MKGRRIFRVRVIVPIATALFVILLLPGASLYYSYSGGRSCARCHEIWQPYRDGTNRLIATSHALTVTEMSSPSTPAFI